MNTAGFLALGLVLLGVYTVLLGRLTKFDDRDALKAGNRAVIVHRLAATAGLVIAMTGSFATNWGYGWKELGVFALDGVLTIAVYAWTHPLLDVAILRKIENDKYIVRGNWAVVLVEAATYVALGTLLCAAFFGFDPSFWTGFASAVVFSALGSLTLVGVYWLYCKAWHLMAKCDIDDAVRQGNLAAAIDAASFIVSLAIVLWTAVIGSFNGWIQDIVGYGLWAVVGIAGLSVLRLFFSVVARLLVREKLTVSGVRTARSEHHGNVVKSTVVGALSIVAAVGWAVPSFI